jgi:DNA-binding NarL/FixJ family response regulator
MMSLRVSIYEDNTPLRESVASLLRLKEGIHVLETYDNVLCIEEQIKKDKPDLILMDIDMPGMNGIEAVKKIRLLNDRVSILMLTVFDDDHHVFDAICAGASGYLLKKHISTRLFDSIDEMLAGGAPMSPSIARIVISSMQHGSRNLNPYSLTPRERQMLGSLSNGTSYKLIASEFSISIDTVRTHIKKIYEKLHVHSQTEAVAKALKEKLV